MAGISNGAFLPLLPSPPLPGSGWTVKVYAHTDLYAYAKGRNPAPIAALSRFQALSWSPEISGTGQGSITLALADPVFAYALADGRTPDSLYRYENLWVIFQDGQWRGEFFGDKVDIARTSLDEAAARTVTIAGPGAAGCLAWAAVLSPYFPKPVPKNKNGVYRYTNVPVMASWIYQLWAEQNRGRIPYVHCRFDAVRDTGGLTWEDTPPPKPKTSTTTTLGDVLFDYDSSALNAAGKKAVTAIANQMKKISAFPPISVVGHADSTGSKAYNQQKGLDRANTVANAALAIAPTARVSTSSMGETQPVASNRTAAGRKKNRRVVVTYQSSPTYVDTVYMPERGTNLLDLLTALTSGQTTAENRGPIHCEWVMQKQFELHVRSQIGVDRSAQVVFHEGSTYLASSAQSFDRSQIANVIAVQNENYAYSSATSPASVAMWGSRVKYTALQGLYSGKVQAQIANTQRQAYADQAVTTTIAVVPGPQRTPFRDFGLGDSIGLVRTHGALPSTVDKQRVVAISVTVDADGHATYEVTLSGTRALRVVWLQTQIDALINRKQGIRAFIQDDQPTGGLPGDLWTPPAFTSNV